MCVEKAPKKLGLLLYNLFMLERFDSQKHISCIENLPFSYISLPIYLDFLGYTFKKNDEDLVVWQDILFNHDFPSIFLPKDKRNWHKASMSLLTEDEINLIESEGIKISVKNPISTEYFYKTSDFSSPKKRKAKRIRRFQNKYNYSVLCDYDKEKVIEFYKIWRDQKDRISNKIWNLDGEDFFLFCLENFDKYNIDAIYVEVDNSLVGFAWGMEHPNGGWASLHLKNLYEYEGLAFFLRSEIAKKYSQHEFFTTGTGCKDEGIENYKRNLGPAYTKDYFYILAD